MFSLQIRQPLLAVQTLNLYCFISINVCTVNVNNENELRCNQIESASFKHNHGFENSILNLV